jgi:4'-phosphopantetheinyl transferase
VVSVAVHSIELDQPEDVVAALASTLDRSEQAAAATRRAESRSRYIAAHGAVRALLASRLGTDPTALVFDRSCELCGHPAHGKPRVEGARALSFSLSHSASCAIVAIAFDSGEVGVDVEVSRPRRHLDRLAARVMTETEYAAWRTTPSPEQPGAFLRVWTAKEAILKATGHGLARPMRSFPARPSGWTVDGITGLPGAVGAVAVEGEHDLDAAIAVAPWTPIAGITLPGAC